MKEALYSTIRRHLARRSKIPTCSSPKLRRFCPPSQRWIRSHGATGLQLGGGLSEANEGDFFVKLKPLPRRSIDAVNARSPH